MAKRLTFVFTVVALLATAVVGCSNHWREVDHDISSEEVMAMLNEVGGGQGFGAGDLTTALNLKDDPATAIYFADAPSSLGPVASVVSLMNFDFLGLPDLWWGAIAQARVFFMDTPTDSGRQAALIIGLDQGSGTFSYHALSGSSTIDGREFVAELSGGGQTRLVLRSFDVQDGDLAAVIQLKAYDHDSSGNERYIGKFSTLVGFGP